MFSASAGTQTSALSFGGYTYAPGAGATKQSVTEEWNGTVWTSGGSLPVAKGQLTGFGTQTAAVASGGQIPPGGATNATDNYNGTSWTAGGNSNQSKTLAFATGTQTLGLMFGGSLPPTTGQTEFYDGTSWTTSPVSLNTARDAGCLGSLGSQTAAIAAGNGPAGVSTEEWTGAGNVVKTLTTS
jgi:hypothetical protein